MRVLLRMTFVTAALAMLPASAFGHGGQLRGPSTTLPPGMGPPPKTGGGPGPTTPGGGIGPVTMGGGPRKAAGPDYTEWDTWWEVNKDAFLDLRARLGSRRSVTGVETQDDSSVRPAFIEVKDVVVPLLREQLSDPDTDVVDSAVLALARITPAAEQALVLPDVMKTLGHDDATVRRAALVALGVLGAKESLPILRGVLDDDAQGRKAMKVTGHIQEAERATAAIALGLIGDAGAIDALKRVALDERDIDLRASAILALGLFETDRTTCVAVLDEILKDTRADDRVRAQVPIALSRLGDDAMTLVPALLQTAKSKKSKNYLRQSCVIALGKLASAEDAEVVDALCDIATRDTDNGASHFAFIALGEIGGRAAPEAERTAKALAPLARFFAQNVTRPPKKDVLPFAATGAALFARHLPAAHDSRMLLGKKLREAFADTRQPLHRSALAVSLGLMEETAAAPMLLTEFESSGDRLVKGYLGLALGLLRSDAATTVLKRELDDDNDPGFRVQLATALGLMGDPEVSDRLVADFRDAKTLYATSSIAKALGHVGDRGAVKPLTQFVGEKKRVALARGFACVALGLLCEKSKLPWNERLAAGSNYLTGLGSQAELLDIL